MHRKKSYLINFKDLTPQRCILKIIIMRFNNLSSKKRPKESLKVKKKYKKATKQN